MNDDLMKDYVVDKSGNLILDNFNRFEITLLIIVLGFSLLKYVFKYFFGGFIHWLFNIENTS